MPVSALVIPILAASQVAIAPAAASADAATAWLALLDQQQWQETWRQASAVVRQRVLIEGWIEAVGGTRKPLGKVVARSLAKVTKAQGLPGAPPGSYEILEFKTDFETRPGAIETVVMAGEPSGWKVAGYFIR